MDININVNFSASPELLQALKYLTNAGNLVMAPILPEIVPQPVKDHDPAEEEGVDLAPEPKTKKSKAKDKSWTVTGVQLDPVTESSTMEKLVPPVRTSTITIEELRNLVHTKAKAGKREEVKAILSSYEAANVTGLPVVHYAEFAAKVEAL